MKLISIILSISLLSNWVHANTPIISLGGVVDFYFEANHAPSSKQGETAFEFSRLELAPQIIFEPEISLDLRWDLAEKRSISGGQEAELENAFLSWTPRVSSQWNHQLGVVRPYWRTSEGWSAEFDNFGDSSKNLARRYGFLSDGDTGYQGLWDKSEETTVAFGFLNGEENKKAETGPSKHVFLGSFYETDDSRVATWLSYGRVDNMEDKYSETLRILMRLQRPWGRFRIAVEALFAQDASTDYEAQGRAEGMTFTELTEMRSISTEAGRFEIYYQLNPFENFLIRWDSLKAELKGKSLESFVLAWIRSEPKLWDWGVFYESTLYGAQHSAQSRQRELVRLGVSKTF